MLTCIATGEDDALSAHYRAPRQDMGQQTTPLPNTADQTMEMTTPKPEHNRLVKILSGTLLSLVALSVALVGIAVVSVLWGCKMKRRRRIQRELVERTQHDIFEGVPNAISGSGSAADDTKPEAAADGAGAGADGPIPIPTHTVINISVNADDSVGFEMMHGVMYEDEDEEEDQ